MTKQNPLDLLLHPSVQHVLRTKAKSLARRRDFRSELREDIHADLQRIIAPAILEYDPTRANLHTYACCCVDSAAKDLIRSRNRHRRAIHNGLASIDDDGGAGTATSAHDTIAARLSDADLARARGVELVCAIDRLVDHLTIREVVLQLTPREFEFCVAIMDGMTLAEAAKSVGRSRDWGWSTRRRIQQRFRDAGFGGSDE